MLRRCAVMRAWAAGWRLKGRSGVMRGAPQPQARVQSTCGRRPRISVALYAYRGTRVRRCARACSMWSLKWRPNCSEESSGGLGVGSSCAKKRKARQRCTRLRCARAAMPGWMGTRRQLSRQKRGVEALIRLRGARAAAAQRQRQCRRNQRRTKLLKGAARRTVSPDVAVCAARSAARPPQRRAPRLAAASIAALSHRARPQR